jgi:hypothetical protein
MARPPPLLLLLLRLCCRLSAQTEHAGRRAFLLQSPANKPVVLPTPDPLSPATPTAAGVTWTPAMLLSVYLCFLAAAAAGFPCKPGRRSGEQLAAAVRCGVV